MTSGADLAALRARAKMTVDEAAAELGVPADAVRRWEAGSARPPARYGKHLAWHTWGVERDAALAASGLPECERQAALLAQLRAVLDTGNPSPERLGQASTAVEEHGKSCPICLARSRYVDEHCGPMPQPPVGGWMRAFMLIDRAPEWTHPAIYGACILAMIVSIRVVFAVPLALSNPRFLGEALLGVGAAAAAGAAGGFAFSLTRPALRRLGRVGDYLSGVVCVCAYMGFLALASPLAFGKSLIGSRSELVVFAIVSVFFGLVMGHSWFAASREAKTSESAAA